MRSTVPKAICVVLNNQHQKRVDDVLRRCASSPGARILFQPYTRKHLQSLHRLDDEGKLPVPIYLVSGQYGAEATAVADLVKVEYREEVPSQALALLEELLPVSDTKIYATNLLYLARARPLQKPIAVERFRKASDDQLLRRGRWPAVVCYAPKRNGAARSSSPGNSDDPEEAVEGHLRALLVRHRQREQRLRRAKIRAVLRASRRLKCEVLVCAFDFEETYGSLGREYAHVHHLRPLAADGQRRTTLSDMAIVCANCHAMIHRGGACRSLKEVSAIVMAHGNQPNKRIQPAARRARRG
jgi:5-methylcytosine-specific restriction endonuclease McrA